MGVTYLAVDSVLRRKVALKVIEVPTVARSSQLLRERFLREARAAAALRHPNVAAVYQFGGSPDGSHRYYAMELVEGETLEARVRRDGPLNAKLVLEIAIQTTRALMAASAHGLVHRDLKPGNIMLTLDDNAELEVKVIDFGLAKAIADAESEMDLTHGEFVGTPNFASPEQFGSGPVDVRSDIYSLGATVWFALTGKTPFAGRNIEEIHRAQQSKALPIEQLNAARVPSISGVAAIRPSIVRIAASTEPALRSGILSFAISSTCFWVTLPAFVLFGSPDPFSTLVALNRRIAVRGRASSVTWDPSRLMVCPVQSLTKSPSRHRPRLRSGGADAIGGVWPGPRRVSRARPGSLPASWRTRASSRVRAWPSRSTPPASG